METGNLPCPEFRISILQFPVSSFEFRVTKRAPSRNPRLRLISIAVLVVWGPLTGCSSPAVPPEPSPPAGIINLDEQTWQDVRARHRGRVLLVNFWATWCEPCREEFPAIVRLHQTYRARGLSVVAISMDEPASVPQVERFLKAQGAQFGSYLHHFRDFSALVDSINPRWGGGIPATFIYDPQGRLADSWEGETTYPELERALRPLLPGEDR